MSDDNGDDFQEFKGSQDPVEEGITTNEMFLGFGFILIIAGFVLGLIRLMALKGGETPNEFASDLEQLYLSYVLMFVGMVITCILGFGSMFKRTISSFLSSEDSRCIHYGEHKNPSQRSLYYKRRPDSLENQGYRTEAEVSVRTAWG